MVEGLNLAAVGGLGQGAVDGDLYDVGYAVLKRYGVYLALAENGDLSSAVGAGDIAHIFSNAQNGDIHHTRHVDCLFDYHTHEILWCCDDDYTVEGNALEDSQRHVARSGGHIDEHIVYISPDDVRPELQNSA